MHTKVSITQLEQLAEDIDAAKPARGSKEEKDYADAVFALAWKDKAPHRSLLERLVGRGGWISEAAWAVHLYWQGGYKNLLEHLREETEKSRKEALLYLLTAKREPTLLPDLLELLKARDSSIEHSIVEALTFTYKKDPRVRAAVPSLARVLDGPSSHGEALIDHRLHAIELLADIALPTDTKAVDSLQKVAVQGYERSSEERQKWGDWIDGKSLAKEALEKIQKRQKKQR